MPRGYRCVIVAAVGWLSLTGQHPDNASQAEQAEAESRIADSLAHISRAYDDQAKRAESAPEGKPCKPGQNQRDSDLCAQWKAADAAEEAAGWAAVSGILSIIGLVGVAGALLLTIQSNRIARRSSERQLRAYVSVGSGGLKNSGRVETTIIISNSGQTPAYQVSSCIHAIIFRKGETVNLPLTYDITPKDITIGAGGSTSATSTQEIALSAANQIEIFNRSAYFLVYGMVTYKDVFDAVRTTRFAHYYTGSKLDSGTAASMNTGNSST